MSTEIKQVTQHIYAKFEDMEEDFQEQVSSAFEQQLKRHTQNVAESEADQASETEAVEVALDALEQKYEDLSKSLEELASAITNSGEELPTLFDAIQQQQATISDAVKTRANEVASLVEAYANDWKFGELDEIEGPLPAFFAEEAKALPDDLAQAKMAIISSGTIGIYRHTLSPFLIPFFSKISISIIFSINNSIFFSL